ncbi:hypothetical protein O9993_14765 [Vibrio lentus]|nr:hypothetical protein [Vibrio lentus]
MKIKYTVTALSVATAPAFAKFLLDGEAGFSGEISINTWFYFFNPQILSFDADSTYFI